MNAPFKYRTGLWVVLAVALGLRVWLASGGGQGYWPDENMRYGETLAVAEAIQKGKWSAAGVRLMSYADHQLFRWIALPPALLDVQWGGNPWRTAVYFSMYSWLAIWLVWSIARRAGAEEDEAFWAALLAAASTSLFLYARHYFPYDASLCLMLFAVWLALGNRGVWRGLGVGLAVGVGFLIYNGYWMLGGAVLSWHCLRGWPKWREILQQGVAAGSGFLIPLSLSVAGARFIGVDMIAGVRTFAGTISQGDFGEGWRVLAGYLWTAEGWLAVFLLAGMAVAIWQVVRKTAPPQLGHGLAIVGLFWAGVWFLSDVYPVFVVYGRIVRIIMPWACLVAGSVLACWLRARRPAWKMVVAAGVVTLAAGNFRQPLQQVFPDRFIVQTQQAAAAQRLKGHGAYRVLNAEHLWGKKSFGTTQPHEVLRRESHPMQYGPYQYEGFSREQRRILAVNDCAMQLVRFTDVSDFAKRDADPRWAGFPGPVRIQLRFPVGRDGYREPLLVTGGAGVGDFIYVHYLDARRIRLGWDHWGGAGWLSEPFEVDFEQDHELVVSGLALMPPLHTGLYADEPGWAEARAAFVVGFNGRLLTRCLQPMHATKPAKIHIGSNFIGGSTTGLAFTGQLLAITPVEWEDLTRLASDLEFRGEWRPAGWGGAPGPFEVEINLAGLVAGERLPLACRGAPGEGDRLTIMKEAAGQFIICYDYLGVQRQSDAFILDLQRPQRLRVTVGSFMPEAESFYQMHPEWEPLRRLLAVEVDGICRWKTWIEPVEAARRWILCHDNSDPAHPFTSILSRVTRLRALDPTEMLKSLARLSAYVPERMAYQGFSGAIRLQVEFPSARREGAEPLLSSGVNGAGDFLFVRYEAEGRIRLGFDHWGAAGGGLSEAIAIRPGEPCELIVSAGFLFSPGDKLPADWKLLTEAVWVELNGQVVLSQRSPVHPAEPEQLLLGLNFIGGSTSERVFTGKILSVQAIDSAALIHRLKKTMNR